MKKTIFSPDPKLLGAGILLALLNTACVAPTLAFAPEPTPVIENTAYPVEEVPITLITPTPVVTMEVQTETQATAELSTSLPAVIATSQANVIRFKVNGTFTDITDMITTGASKTYSLNAMKGQIMSISILPVIPEGGWGYIPMQIKGEDGVILCPQLENSECMFWRGVLPTSQDYFITLTPVGDVPKHIMRVAINPPGKINQYFQYTNSGKGLSLTYPDTFAPAMSVVGNYKTNPELTLHYIDSETYDKTNLSEVYMFISSTADSQVVATCTEPNQYGGAPEQLVGNETVNGYTFVYSTSEGAGAGNYYQQEIYRMVEKKVCYEVIYYVHYLNIGNFPPGLVIEFDGDDLRQEFYSVFSTFAIK